MDFKKDEYSLIWMQNICNALNKAGLMMPDHKGGGEWNPNKFSSVVELIQFHVTLYRGIFNFLEEKGLANTGRCPITGEKINNQICYQIFGRKVFLSEKGKAIAQEIDREERVKYPYDEPSDEVKKRAKDIMEDLIQEEELFLQERRGGKIIRRTIGLILLMIIFKTCSSINYIMRPEIKEFLVGLVTLFGIGYLLNIVIEPSSFGGGVLVIILTLVLFAILKFLIERKRRY